MSERQNIVMPQVIGGDDLPNKGIKNNTVVATAFLGENRKKPVLRKNKSAIDRLLPAGGRALAGLRNRWHKVDHHHVIGNGRPSPLAR